MNKPHKVKVAKEEKTQEKPAPVDTNMEKIKANLDWIVQELQDIKDRLDKSPF